MHNIARRGIRLRLQTTVADRFLEGAQSKWSFATAAESGPMFVFFNSCKEILGGYW